MWKYFGQERPPFALPTREGEESVWDYPRPPALAPCTRLVLVEADDEMLARSTETYRVMETASPPGFYIPEKDVNWDKLAPAPGRRV